MIIVTRFSPSWFNTIFDKEVCSGKEEKEYETNLEVFERPDDYYDEADERQMWRHGAGYQNTIEMADGNEEKRKRKINRDNELIFK